MVRVVKVATRRSVGAYPVPSLAPQVIFSEDNRTLYALNAYSDTSGTGSLSILDRDKTVDVDKAVDVSTDPEQADFLCPVSPDGATLSRASNEQ